MAGKNSEDRRLIRSITLRNILSFGPDTPALELGNLNVLVGPNGSGKSNLLEALSLLRKVTGDPRRELSRAGGVSEWIWKDNPDDAAVIEAVVWRPAASKVIRHRFAFRVEQQQFRVEDERIEHGSQSQPLRTRALYDFRKGQPQIAVGGQQHAVTKGKFDPSLSILAQRNDPERYPEIAALGTAYREIRLYLGWRFGRSSRMRRPQASDLPSQTLQADFANLGMVLSRYRRNTAVKARLIECLRDLYDGLTDFEVSPEGGTVQVFFLEGNRTIPATRLSDGSLRYLCLLVILLDPDPPPLIGIEEPELGLHPDLIPKIAELLVEASQRTQLIVTTHSDTLVDALTERPESVIVCEKHGGATTMERLDGTKLQPWLAKYRLGDLWTKGEIGGNRW
jgi:predicted ATPase